MTDSKSLKSKAINIKGKSYVQVADRVLFFVDTYPNGSITTELLSEPSSDTVVIKATVTPDCDKPQQKFTGLAQEVWGSTNINKTSAMENGETSAVGRALAFMGIGVIESIASVDEVHKAVNREKAIENPGTCAKCGAPNKISKMGKPYCSNTCWLKTPETEKADRMAKAAEIAKDAPPVSPLPF